MQVVLQIVYWQYQNKSQKLDIFFWESPVGAFIQK